MYAAGRKPVAGSEVVDLVTEDQQRWSPLVARTHLARRIVEFRERAGLKQPEAAARTGISRPKLQYLEAGTRPIQESDLEAILVAYEVPEADHDEWRALAQKARAKGWWDAYDDADLPKTAKRFTGYEWGARRIRCFTGSLVPPLLQTADYTIELLRAGLVHRPSEQVAKLVEVRRRRQQILDHPDPLEYHAVMDQAALHREAGGPDVLAVQLEHIAEVAEQRPNVTVQVVPWSAGLYPAQAGTSSVIDLDYDLSLVHLEPGLAESLFLDDRRDVYLYAQVFERILDVALDPDETTDLLRTVAHQVRGATHG